MADNYTCTSLAPAEHACQRPYSERSASSVPPAHMALRNSHGFDDAGQQRHPQLSCAMQIKDPEGPACSISSGRNGMKLIKNSCPTAHLLSAVATTLKGLAMVYDCWHLRSPYKRAW